MAEDVKYTISVDASQAKQGTEQVNESLGRVNQNAEKSSINFRQLGTSLSQVMVAAGGVAIGFQAVAQLLRDVERDTQAYIKSVEDFGKAAANQIQFMAKTTFDRQSELYKQGLITEAEFQKARVLYSKYAEDAILDQRFQGEHARIESLKRQLETEEKWYRKLYAGIADGAGSYGDRVLYARIALNRSLEELAEKEKRYKETEDFNYLIGKATGDSLITAKHKAESDKRIAQAKKESDARQKAEQDAAAAAAAAARYKAEAARYEFDVQVFYLQQLEAWERAEDDIKTQLLMNRLSLTSSTLSAARAMLGEHTMAYKGIAIAEATINTYLAATKALTAGPILGPILAAVTIATGLAQVAAIAGIGIGGGSATAPVAAPSIQPPAPPSMPAGTFTGDGAGYSGGGARTSMAATEAVPATIYYNQSITIHGNVMGEDLLRQIAQANYNLLRAAGQNVIPGGLG